MRATSRFELAETLTPKQRSRFFQVGSEIQSIESRRMGLPVDSDHCHEIAYAMLDATGWKSAKTAMSMWRQVS